ncbi:hypothetical protein U1769_02080 [Sphingomonas sp. ZT3P38]|uniref:hypothetical protein n=1 Tax=Parasphingomonas zepuensis TaxID=3096161 RepID=UPI002FC6E7E8
MAGNIAETIQPDVLLQGIEGGRAGFKRVNAAPRKILSQQQCYNADIRADVDDRAVRWWNFSEESLLCSRHAPKHRMKFRKTVEIRDDRAVPQSESRVTAVPHPAQSPLEIFQADIGAGKRGSQLSQFHRAGSKRYSDA